jgi:hypothetical protein
MYLKLNSRSPDWQAVSATALPAERLQIAIHHSPGRPNGAMAGSH